MSALVPTPSQTVGPFFSFGMQWLANGNLLPPGSPGSFVLHGRVLDGEGAPVPDAVVEVWQADPEGRYDSGGRWIGFGRSLTDEDGNYRFVTVLPGSVDGVQAPHVDFSLFARGLLQRLMTRMYFETETEANAADPLLASIDPARWHTILASPDEEGFVFDIRLQGPHETVFLAW